MAQQLPDDFREFLKLLNDHKVEYLLVGGYAVGYYGHPRNTADLDIWVKIGKRNAQRVTNCLRAFGFDLPDLHPDLFLEEKNIVRMGVPPLRLEILMSISGVTFKACYARRRLAQYGTVSAPTLHLEDLIRNKIASGRPKDLEDVMELQRIKEQSDREGRKYSR